MTSRDNIINAIRSRAEQTLPKGASVTLFGSQARGDYHDVSDWDLLVLIDTEHLSMPERTDYVYAMMQLGWELNADINPIIYTNKDWAKRSFTPFYKNVTKDGIILWDNTRLSLFDQ
jgi:predicted nucleotidyltransferase